MGLFLCDVCNEQIDVRLDTHKCDSEKIKALVGGLREEARTARNKLDDIRNNVLMMLHELPPFEGDQATVSTKWLKKLWDASDNQWYSAKSADDFLVHWMVTHRILCEAYDVFRFKKGETLLEKLKNLRKACDNSLETLGYKGNFALTPENLVNDLSVSVSDKV